jgi:hypothetical protein
VTLFENPIFLTQKRLVHRAGVFAAMAIAALIGLSFVVRLIAYMMGLTILGGYQSIDQIGKVYYGWILALEIIILPIAGFCRISRMLFEDRKAGLWDSNRLTPLKPANLVLGYWFGPALRETYAAVVLAAFSLVIVVMSGLPITFWLGTQVLVWSTGFFFGLLAVLTGLSTPKSEGSAMLLLTLLLLVPISQMRLILTNFLLPVNGIYNLLHDATGRPDPWATNPTFFGIEIPSIIFCLALQILLGVLLWRVVTRKVAHPFQPLLQRWEALVLFAILLIAQHSLLWGIWRGHFPAIFDEQNYRNANDTEMMPFVHIATIGIGMILLAAASPHPQQVRIKALQTGRSDLRLVFSRSALPLALGFSIMAGLVLFTYFDFTTADSTQTYLIAVGNLLVFFLVFTLLMEVCRLFFRQRAASFGALALFILCILPLILGGVFESQTLARCSILTPGVLALGIDGEVDLPALLQTVAAHFVIAVLLFFLWRSLWLRLLPKAKPATAKV